MTSTGTMNTYRKTAIAVGAFFVIGTVAGVLSGVFSGGVIDDPDYLVKFAANRDQIIMTVILTLTMAFPLAMVPVLLFPILRRHNETLALGAVVFRGVLEAFGYILIVICFLLLLSLSQEYVKAGAPEASHFQTLGALILEANDWSNDLLAIVFSIGALMIYYLFYQSKLVPRWLSVWGLIGATLYLAAPLINMFDPQHSYLTIAAGAGRLMAPLALQEMVFALWMIVKGFNPSAIASLSAKQN